MIGSGHRSLDLTKESPADLKLVAVADCDLRMIAKSLFSMCKHEALLPVLRVRNVASLFAVTTSWAPGNRFSRQVVHYVYGVSSLNNFGRSRPTSNTVRLSRAGR